MKINIQFRQLAGFTAVFFPVVAFLLSKVWSIWAVATLFSSGPTWWPRRGLEMGLIPGLLCGIVGLTAGALGLRLQNRFLVVAGLWCCLAAPIICFLYIGATF